MKTLRDLAFDFDRCCPCRNVANEGCRAGMTCRCRPAPKLDRWKVPRRTCLWDGHIAAVEARKLAEPPVVFIGRKGIYEDGRLISEQALNQQVDQQELAVTPPLIPGRKK